MQRSEQINELATALVAARQKFLPVKKTHTATMKGGKADYSYKYATLEDMQDASFPALHAAGVVSLQNVETGKDALGVSTMLLHTSGQFIQTDPVWLPCGTTPQSVGSAITYAKRYSLGAALGIAAEEDNDGRGAGRQASAKPKASQPAQSDGGPLINDAQRKRLFTIATTANWTKDDVKHFLETKGYTSSKDIRVRDYDAIVRVIETGEMVEDEVPA